MIRPIAICVFSDNGRILVIQFTDPTKQTIFYRPVGGGIDFGEPSCDTVVREVREELNAEITALRLLGTLENIYVYDGRPGHEIVQVYDGRFVDDSLYQKPVLPGDEGGNPFQAVWKPLSDFEKVDAPPLYPSGLLELLTNPK